MRKLSPGQKKPTKAMIDAGVRAFGAACALDLGEAETYRDAILEAYLAMDDLAWARSLRALKRMNDEDIRASNSQPSNG